MSFIVASRRGISRLLQQKWPNCPRFRRTSTAHHLRLVHPQASTCAIRSFSSSNNNADRTTGHSYPIFSLPTEYLRASDPTNFDPDTHQRTDVAIDPHNGKPLIDAPPAAKQRSKPQIRTCALIEREQGFYRVEWDDGRVSEYSSHWVDDQLKLWKGRAAAATDRVLWNGMTEDKVRNSSALSMNFSDILTDDGMKRAIKALYQYGILLVKDTPIDDGGAGVAALASSVGGGSVKNQTSLVQQYQQGGTQIMLPQGTDGPLRTLYGTVWSTTSAGQAEGASQADSAYGFGGLPLHTDMTYHGDPPGLQIFTMVQPADKGGESLFGDGFAAAERLRETNPSAFDILSSVTRRYRSVDRTTGWHLEAHGPVITTRFDQVAAIRHNDLDRLPDLPPAHFDSAEVDRFYQELQEAHAAWDAILADDEFRLVFALQAGETMVVVNQRCFHGRYGFEATEKPRAVMGCYVGQDELSSRFRMEGFCVP